MNKILETSIVFLLVRHFTDWYYQIEQGINNAYRNSRTQILVGKLLNSFKIYFRLSIIGRVTESKEGVDIAVSDESQTVQCLKNLYRVKRDRIEFYKNLSKVFSLAKMTKEEFYISAVKMVSIVAVIAIIVNIFSSLILQKQIDLWGWLMRGLFLFAAMAGLFCKADWPTIKNGSIVFKLLAKRQLTNYQ